MTIIESSAIAEAKKNYEQACGAVRGSDYTGFMLAMLTAFYVQDHWASTTVPSIVAQLVAGMMVLFCVRNYYRRAQRAAEDAYHRSAGLGQYTSREL